MRMSQILRKVQGRSLSLFGLGLNVSGFAYIGGGGGTGPERVAPRIIAMINNAPITIPNTTT